MRYISPHENLSLKTNDGRTAYQFNYGELDLGAGVVIDAIPGTDTDNHLCRFAATWAGTSPTAPTAAEAREMSGMGNLSTPTDLQDYKYRRTYYEAPILVTGLTTVAATLGIYYKVLSGTVTYNGVAYRAGQTFIADGTVVDTTGTGTFCVWFNLLLWDEAYQSTTEAFRNVHLNQGTEATGYWDFQNNGATARGLGYVTP